MKCIVCKTELENLYEEGIQPMGGLHFYTYGHYGSAYFDPFDGSSLSIVVCDNCLSKNKDIIFERS